MMTKICMAFLLITILTTAVSWRAAGQSCPAKDFIKTRLIIMADMGNEPDEEQQMTHMLLYSNMFDLEGLIACSGKYLNADRTDGRTETHPELFHKLIDGYAKVVENLKLHASGWPDVDYLRSIVRAGANGYGIGAAGPGKSSDASKLIEAALLKDDPRKVYIVGNAGTNSLAQALVDLGKKSGKDEMDALCRKIIVFENGAQDDCGAWIAQHYPDIAWHRSNHQTYAYGGPGNDGTGPYTWEPYARSAEGQNDWAKEHIMTGHGALGACFPPRFVERLHFIEGGGTTPWMGLVNHGMSDPERLYWGGWSGRFSRVRHKNIYSRHPDIRKDEEQYGDFHMFEADSETETWTDPVHGQTYEGLSVPVWRFRRAMYNDFRGRMDWCVKPYKEANHNPVAAFDGDRSNTINHLTVQPGQRIALNASQSTDPDGDDLRFTWWVYREAGTYDKDITIPDSSASVTSLTVPSDADGKEIHIILEVRDNSAIVPMYDYRRIVVSVPE